MASTFTNTTKKPAASGRCGLRCGAPVADTDLMKRAAPLSQVFLSAILLFGFACGDDDGLLFDSGVDAALDGALDGSTPAVVHAIYAPAADPMPFGVMPFPDDHYLDEDGYIALGEFPEENAGEEPSAFIASLRDGLATLDGFGVSSPIYLPFDGDVDVASLPGSPSESLAEGASVFLVDADADSPQAFERLEANVYWLPAEQTVAVRPVAPLLPGHNYAVVLTSGVTAMGGASAEPSDVFASIRDAVRDNRAPTDIDEQEAYERCAPVLDALGEGASEVVTMSVFRVQSAPNDLVQARLQLREGTPDVVIDQVVSGAELDALLGTPEESLAGRDLEGGVLHDAIGWMVHGSIAVPNYMSELEGVHGRFERDEAGDVVVKRIDRAPFTLLLPASVEASTPIVIFQHGVTDNRSGVLGMANTLAAAGYASIAIDAPFHGLRAATSEPDTRNVWTGEEGPDGFGEATGLGVVLSFIGASETEGEYPGFHPIYFRDALRQSAADLHALVHAIQAGDWSGLGAADPDLEGLSLADSALAFAGHSLGGIIGTIFVATEPSVGAALLSVTGGHLARLVERSVSFSLQLSVILPMLNLEGRATDDSLSESILSPGAGLYQTLLAAGDAAAYAPLLRESDTDVLMNMVRHDETVPNSATEDLALALNIPITGGEAHFADLRPATLPLSANATTLTGTATRGLHVFELGSHGSLLSRRGEQTVVQPPEPPFVFLEETVRFDTPIDLMQSQMVSFFDSWRAGATEIRAPE